ncbi:penicillin-binding protein activator [Legionella sp. CNM-4043-24]|uniref:penicillin-binding protein activator n=1 Tax=Legionella sp. CNM-4043-24 TaxID=3421646 RepID=UPI00403A8920
MLDLNVMLMSVRVARSCIFFCSVMFLCQCTKAVNVSPQPKKQASGPFSMPAAAYLALANNQPEEERQSMFIMAAGRYLYDGQWQEASRILTQTAALSPVQNDEKNILLAKIDAIRAQPTEAINRLSSVKELASLPAYYQAQYHDVLASSYEAAGHAGEAIVERIKADPLLADDASRRTNQKQLWLSLARLPLPELSTLSVEAREGSDAQAWLQLALIPRQADVSEPTLLTQVEQWQQRNPEHPANQLLPQSLSSIKPWMNKTPQRMALLLPVSGPLAGPGNAVRDGFMAAYQGERSEQDSNVRVYDTAKADVTSLYEQAIADGAEYVVGPLTKADAARVAALDHPVPTLLLNDVEVEPDRNIWQFGLSPVNEARQVAIKAHNNGLSKALVIAPSGTWGDDVVAAFSAQWQKSGATVVERMAYDNTTDLGKAVRDLLHVSEKSAQEKQVKPLPGQTAAFMTKRRQDFDMIFLIAYPSRARQIMPLLRYYFAGDVPVYATSSVYAGNTNTLRDRDLNGLIFCDMPWVFKHQLANKNWPEQFNSYTRLYALGADSYRLSSRLNQLMLFPAMSLQDQGDILYLNHARQVARIPAWGQFKNGVAVPIHGSV